MKTAILKIKKIILNYSYCKFVKLRKNLKTNLISNCSYVNFNPKR